MTPVMLDALRTEGYKRCAECKALYLPNYRTTVRQQTCSGRCRTAIWRRRRAYAAWACAA